MLNYLNPAILSGILALGGTGAITVAELPTAIEVAPPTATAAEGAALIAPESDAPGTPKGKALGETKGKAKGKARGHHMGARGENAPGRARSRAVRERNLTRMAERLDLTEAQTAKIKTIAAETRRDVVEARKKGKERIDAVLTPEQRKELAQMKAAKARKNHGKKREPRVVPTPSS